MISVDNVTVEFGGRALFSDVTFNINEKDRIALMGKNGAGKSTLLKIIAGADKATRGKISAPSDAVIAYLPQHLLMEDDSTVFEETTKAFSQILSMKAEIDDLNHQLETRTDYESDAYMNIIERVSEVSEKLCWVWVSFVQILLAKPMNLVVVGVCELNWQKSFCKIPI
jgi:ATP-binding cassette, subfamily F, member 3